MKAPLSWSSLVFVVFGLLAAVALPAQDGSLTLHAAFEPATAKPGAEVELVLTATVSDGYHAYGARETTQIPVALPAKSLKLGGLEAVGAAVIPPGERTVAHGFETYPLPQEFTVKQRLRVPANVATNAITVTGELAYQVCDESSCLPPAREAFTATLRIDGVTAGAGPAQESPAGVKPGLRLDPDAKLAVTATMSPATARAGERVTLVLECAVVDGWHVYGTLNRVGPPVSLDTTKLRAGGLEPDGAASVPPGVPVEKHGTSEFHLAGMFKVEQRLAVPADAKPGSITIQGELDYMACDESHCEPETTAPFEAMLTIEAGEARPDALAPEPAVPPDDGAGLRQPKYTLDDVGGNALTGSLWSLILLAIAGGLFALAMPCTYPMIPITFSFFTKQADRMQGRVLPLALTYGIGIVLMFVLVGVVVGGPIIAFAGHWATNLVIGVAFVVFALSLFGFFTLQLPSFVTNAAGKASATGGLVGVFLMGATLVVSSFTCTAPIVGALLAGVAEGGYGRVALGMAVFGLTMAAPFVFLALLPGRVKALPKSGEWMHTLKVSLGFVELAAALKFFSNVDLARGWNILPREVFLITWAFAFVLLALFLFGLLGPRGEPVVGTSKVRTTTGIASLALAFYCLFGTMGFALDPIMTAFEPPYRLRPVDEHTIVKDDHDAATVLAAREKKYLLVNFTGFT